MKKINNLPVCPICDKETSFLEDRRGIDNKVSKIFICKECLLVINSNSKKDDLELQKSGLENVYTYRKEELDSVNKKLAEHVLHIRNLMKISSIKPEGKIFFELGYGKGLSLFAAKEIGFKKVIGVDLNLNSFNQISKHLDSSNMEVFENIDSVKDKVDCIYIWHVLEHVDKPLELFSKFTKIANSKCKILLQVPQYSRSYICDVHHYFYNESSINKLFSLFGFVVDEIFYDHDNEFMAVIGSN